MSIYKKLMDVRKAFHALPLKKGGKNTFAKYEYFELGDFVQQATVLMADAGLCPVVSFEAGEAVMRIFDVSGEVIVIRSPMGSADLKGCHEVQNIGAVQTYQRRYLWQAALDIVESDALDATTGNKSKTGALADSARDAKKSIATDRQGALMDTAAYIADLKNMDDWIACSGVLAEITDNEEKVFVWGELRSDVRSWIKKNQESDKKGDA